MQYAVMMNSSFLKTPNRTTFSQAKPDGRSMSLRTINGYVPCRPIRSLTVGEVVTLQLTLPRRMVHYASQHIQIR